MIDFELNFAKLQFGLSQRAAIYKKVIAFSKQGSPIYNTLMGLYEAYPKNDPRAIIINEWLESLHAGGRFSDALVGYAPEAEVMLIAAGEAAGDLENGVNCALFVTNAVGKIKSTIIGGLAYGVIVLLMLLGMVGMFSVSVIPQLAMLMPPSKWQGAAADLYFMSMFVKSYGVFILVAVVVFLIIILKTLAVFRGHFRQLLDKTIPPWSIHNTMESSIFLITLSSLMSAGVSINKALQQIMDKSSPYMGWYVDKIMDNFAAGFGNGESMDVGFFDKDTAIDINLYGKVTDFQSAIMAIGQDSVGNAISRISASTKLISMALLFFAAGYTGFVYYGFYTLTSSIAGVTH